MCYVRSLRTQIVTNETSLAPKIAKNYKQSLFVHRLTSQISPVRSLLSEWLTLHHTRDVDAMIQIEEKQRCCGCEACRQICPKGCIRLELDEEGFDYPIVDTDRCIECHKCERVCPFMKLDEPRKPQAVYAACATDEELRRASSSGGLFTLLAEDTLRRGGVVFGARFDEAWSVCHDYTETIEGLAPFRGSSICRVV